MAQRGDDERGTTRRRRHACPAPSVVSVHRDGGEGATKMRHRQIESGHLLEHGGKHVPTQGHRTATIINFATIVNDSRSQQQWIVVSSRHQGVVNIKAVALVVQRHQCEEVLFRWGEGGGDERALLGAHLGAHGSDELAHAVAH